MLNLGDINFGIDVDTNPLARSLTRIVNFGAEVERAAKRTAAGSEEVAAALQKQERTILANLQTVLKLQQTLEGIGAPSAMVKELVAAFDTLTRSMTSGQVGSLAFQRAMEGFRATLGKVRRDLSDFKEELKSTASASTLLRFTPEASFSKMVADLAGVKMNFLSAADSGAVFERELGAVGGKITGIASAGFHQLVSDLAGVQKGFLSAADSAKAFQNVLPAREGPITRANNFLPGGNQQKGRVLQTDINSAITNAIPALGPKIDHGYTDAVVRAGKESRLFVEVLRDLASASTLSLGPLSAIGARVTALTSILTRQNIGIAGAIAGFAGLTLGAFELSRGAIQTAISLSIIQQRFEAVGGNATIAAEQLTHVHATAERLGLDFITLADSFSRFLASTSNTGISFKEIQNIFDTFSAAGSKLHLPAQDMQRIFLALEQMVSKGTVSSEELRRQLGNALPGAFRIAADAIGVTTEQLNKMLKAGELSTVYLLPKLAEQMKKTFHIADDFAPDTLVSSLGKLSTATTDLFVKFDEATGVSVAYKAAIDGLTASFKLAADNMENIKAAAVAVGVGLSVAFAPTVVRTIMMLSGVIYGASRAVYAFVAAVAAGRAATLSFAAAAGVLARAFIGAALAYGAYKALTGGGDNALDAQIEKTKMYAESIKGVELATSDQVKKHIDGARQQVRELQALIDKDKERLQNIQTRGGTFNGNPIAGVEKGLGAMWDTVVHGVSGANKSLDEHKDKMAGLRQNIRDMTVEYNRLLAAEKGGTKGMTSDQSDAIAEANERMANLQRLIGAAKQGKSAFKEMNDQIQAETKAKSIGADILGATGWSPEKIAQWKKDFITAQTTVDKLSASFSRSGTGRSMDAYNDMVREIGQNWAQTAALMSSEGAGKALDKQFDAFDKADNARQRIEGLGLGAKKAAAMMADYQASLDAVREAQDKWALIKLEDQITRTNEMAEAFKKGEGALEALTRGFDREDQLQDFNNAVIEVTNSEEKAARITALFNESLMKLDASRGTKAMQDLNRELDRTNARIALVGSGGGQPELDELERNFDHEDTVRSIMEGQQAANIMFARQNELIKEGVDPTKALGQAFDELHAKAMTIADSNRVWANMAPQIRDTRELWKDFARTIDSGAGQISEQLVALGLHGEGSLSDLGDTFSRMVDQMIADTIRMQVIKPMFDAIFSGFTGTANTGMGGMTSGPGGGMFGGMLGGLFGGGGTGFPMQDVRMMGGMGGGGGMGGMFSSLLGGLGGLFGGGGGMMANTVGMTSVAAPAMDLSSLMMFLPMIGKGAAWSNGVRYAAKGMVLSGSTMFNTSNGPVMGGELGKNSEALMPLARDGQGRLGIKAMMDGTPSRARAVMNTGIGVMNIYTRDSKDFGYSANQIGNRVYTAQMRANRRNG